MKRTNLGEFLDDFLKHCENHALMHPGKIERLEPKVMEVDGSDDFPFQSGDV